MSTMGAESSCCTNSTNLDSITQVKLQIGQIRFQTRSQRRPETMSQKAIWVQSVLLRFPRFKLNADLRLLIAIYVLTAIALEVHVH
jgi:hypothetical protein